MRLLGLLEEIRLEDVGLQGAARLARYEEERLLQIDRALETLALRRIGRVEHMQFREARHRAEALFEPLGPQAGAAHAEQQHIAEAAALDVVGEGLELANRLELV